jgi:hypothetical protein
MEKFPKITAPNSVEVRNKAFWLLLTSVKESQMSEINVYDVS